ncbi:MAG: DUF2269 domain-containing protein [Immundisolibacteraceae bacterium]|nr:DUF2269 domain-containing protein [Immundisolibacteraceae bacterium]
MDSYLLLKILHIGSAITVLGTGAGIAFFMLMASRSKNLEAIRVTTEHVVLADWIFTAPAVATQIITGLLLMIQLGYSFTSIWFITVSLLYLLIGCCWIPVLVIQYRLRDIARSARESLADTAFTRLMTIWITLGCIAFTAVFALLVIMVIKPLPVI